MKSILQVLEYPTVVDNNHESVYRSYQVLELAEDLLERYTPPDVVLFIIRELRQYPKKGCVEVKFEEV